jgi:hypothetical protein
MLGVSRSANLLPTLSAGSWLIEGSRRMPEYRIRRSSPSTASVALCSANSHFPRARLGRHIFPKDRPPANSTFCMRPLAIRPRPRAFCRCAHAHTPRGISSTFILGGYRGWRGQCTARTAMASPRARSPHIIRLGLRKRGQQWQKRVQITLRHADQVPLSWRRHVRRFRKWQPVCSQGQSG